MSERYGTLGIEPATKPVSQGDESKSSVSSSPEPKSARTIDALNKSVRWRLTLDECISIALQNSHVAKTLGVRASTTPDKDDKSLSRIVLRRINVDVKQTDVEMNVRNFLFEVSQAYWNLHFQNHKLDAVRTGFGTAHATWKDITAKRGKELANGEAANEAQARAQYFSFKSRLKTAETELKDQESRLRYLLGLSATDGRLILPIDVREREEFKVDWEEIKREALSRSPELRQSRRRIKNSELQFVAAKKQLLPQVDETSLERSLQMEGNSQRLTGRDYDEWKLAFQYQQPVGLRPELAQVRNVSLQLKRSRKQLEELELEIVHDLSGATRRLRDSYRIAQTQQKMLYAYRDQAEAAERAFRISQSVPLDVVLDAHSRQAQAEIDYCRATTEYQCALHEIHYRKGTLLDKLRLEFDKRSGKTPPVAKE